MLHADSPDSSLFTADTQPYPHCHKGIQKKALAMKEIKCLTKQSETTLQTVLNDIDWQMLQLTLADVNNIVVCFINTLAQIIIPFSPIINLTLTDQSTWLEGTYLLPTIQSSSQANIKNDTDQKEKK